MPLYDVQCSQGHIAERLAKWDEPIVCACGQPAERLISLPVVRPDLEPYYDNGLGARVESRAHRRQIMAAKSLMECDTGKVKPNGSKGTIFSFAGRTTSSSPKSGSYLGKI